MGAVSIKKLFVISDPEGEQRYFVVLDIRNGKRLRPAEYD